MNKFEKKAMAKRAYRALVKNGGLLRLKDPYYEQRPTPDMMTQYEFEHNGDGDLNNPKFSLGQYTTLYHNTARPDEIPQTDPDYYTASSAARANSYPKYLSRPFGPVLSPSAAWAKELDMHNGKNRDPITGLIPWSYYKLTGQQPRLPKMDATPLSKGKYTSDSPYILLDDTPEP